MEKEMLLDFEASWLKDNNSYYTLKEILQQPSVWNKITADLKLKEEEIKNFIDINIEPDTKIILTGAGTSEFVGNSIFQSFYQRGYNIASIPTTDLITGTTKYFKKNEKLLLVSFARSGNSPESLGAFNIVNKLCSNVKNIIITCNAKGELIKNYSQNSNNFLCLLPPEANDKSFAMTSSFTGMMMAFSLIMDIQNIDNNIIEINNMALQTEKNIKTFYQEIKKIAKQKNDRIVFLGADELKGISQESHLKVLELSAGEVNTFFNSPMGFRHGPKSILNKNTIVFLLMNLSDYQRKYDIDLVKELHNQKQIDKLVILDFKNDIFIKANCDHYFNFNIQDCELFVGLNYIIFAQIYAFYKSLFLNKTPDNPWPSGLVNRVVEGVTIYELEEQ
ncbi:tagatose-6-phosphate ketose/aldose isomerase [Spiroplasma sabaudiense Ar-1343]|uniref:Tagatose-6-phosphate ketose/aldose isomerase n=1 Tax=Spiroplasma sabaudiense Ar-1343 TaxID=1276257 RepID=W6A9W3_9MOLU|nr:SIS domain-containing protein [Spiroplasma sabaudiense]AHI53766.1 tagatose-6-phosphate ketose/aldose isomerase [Spiroplasma sabaudiense Ar-1343]